jgi:hypothetical protein
VPLKPHNIPDKNPVHPPRNYHNPTNPKTHDENRNPAVINPNTFHATPPPPLPEFGIRTMPVHVKGRPRAPINLD